MGSFVSEDDVEKILLEQFQELGYARLPDLEIGPDGKAPERASYGDVILRGRLEAAVAQLNTHIPAEAREDAIKRIIGDESASLIEENRRLHRAIIEGVDVEFHAEDGIIRGDKVWLVDFDKPDANDWLVVDQLTVIENGHKRRPDVAVFVNGLPLAVIELKNPSTEAATLAHLMVPGYLSDHTGPAMHLGHETASPPGYFLQCRQAHEAQAYAGGDGAGSQ